MTLLNRCTGVNQKQMRKDHLLQFGFTIKRVKVPYFLIRKGHY